MQRNIVKSFKYPLALLFLLFLIALMPSLARSIKSKSQSFMLSPLNALRSLRSDFALTFKGPSLRNENRMLKEKVAALTVEVSGLEEASRENQRLRKLLEFKKNMPFKSIPAEVIARDASGWMDVIIINKGKDDGITPHMAVSTYKALIGSVIEVGKHSSKIRLIADPDFRAAVRLKKGRQDGILLGLWGGLCKMIYISEDADVEAGDEVVTSDFSGLFRPGIPIGNVLKVGKEKGMLYKYAIVKPLQDLSNLEEVLCIK